MLKQFKIKKLKANSDFQYKETEQEKKVVDFILQQYQLVLADMEQMYVCQIVSAIFFYILYKMINNQLNVVVALAFLMALYLIMKCMKGVELAQKDSAEKLEKLKANCDYLNTLFENPRLKGEHKALLKLIITKMQSSKV